MTIVVTYLIDKIFPHAVVIIEIGHQVFVVTKHFWGNNFKQIYYGMSECVHIVWFNGPVA